MRLHIVINTIAVLLIYLCNNTTNAVTFDSRQDLLIEAGCKYLRCGRCTPPKWGGSGMLLVKGACILSTYEKSVIPEKGDTKVFSTIERQQIREVDSKKKQVTVDFTLTMRWMDDAIHTNFSGLDNKTRSISIHTEKAKDIWKPDLHIYNISNYKSYWDSKQERRLEILTKKEVFDIHSVMNTGKQNNKTAVLYTFDARSTVYCNFDLSAYPLDIQVCEFRFGSRSSEAVFVLHDPNGNNHLEAYYEADNFHVTISFFDQKLGIGRNMVGFNIKMVRIVTPYIMEYYLPCIAVVLVSEIGFIIPLTAIPGRVALLVTQFLTLTNLFIQHIVSTNPRINPEYF